MVQRLLRSDPLQTGGAPRFRNAKEIVNNSHENVERAVRKAHGNGKRTCLNPSYFGALLLYIGAKSGAAQLMNWFLASIEPLHTEVTRKT